MTSSRFTKLSCTVVVAVLLTNTALADGVSPADPRSPAPKCSASDACYQGDPIHVPSRVYHHRLNVFSVNASPRDLKLDLTYSSTYETWYHFNTNLLEDALLRRVPKPFGGDSIGLGRSLQWNHSWFAFAANASNLASADIAATYPDYLMFRDSTGGQQEFGGGSSRLYTPADPPSPDCVPATTGVPAGLSACWLGPSEFSPASPGRALRFTSTTGGGLSGYALFQPDGTIESYGARFLPPWQYPGRAERELWFLQSISDAAGRTLATVQYQKPFPGCAEGDSGSQPGVPYISTVTSASGQVLKFHYAQIDGLYDFQDPLIDPQCGPQGFCVQQLCVLRSIEAIPAGASTGVEVARFSYEEVDGAEWPGLLREVVGAANSEQYVYTRSNGSPAPPFGGFQTFERKRGGATVGFFSHEIDQFSGQATTYSTGLGEDVEILPASPLGANTTSRPVKKSVASNGTFETTPADYIKTLLTQPGAGTLEMRPFVTEETDACDGAPNACSAGTRKSLIITGSAATLEAAHVAGKSDKRGNWVMMPTQLVYPKSGSASVLPAREQQATLWGVAESEALANPDQLAYPSALSSETYEWRYSPEGVQQPLKVRRASVVDGSTAETEYRYENAPSGGSRLAAMFETGKTKLFGDEALVTRVRATFYKTRRACKETGAADPLSRTVRIEGPCFVADTTATECPNDAQVVEFVYYPLSSGPVGNRGRLKAAWQFPEGKGPSCRDASVGLSTTYDNYTPAGDPGSETDANGVTQTLTWGGSLGAEKRELTKRSVPSSSGPAREWLYRWENHKLVGVTYPEGNKERFCYRDDSVPPVCAGQWTEQLQWQGKCNAAEDSCPEIISYSYWADQTLASRRYLSDGELRKEDLYASDAHKRLTAVRSGVVSVTEKRAYDGADNLTAIGAATNAAPDFCSNGASKLCTWLAYDRADRLAEVDFHPDLADGTSKTFFEHDTNGNIRRVAAGCDEAATRPADHSTNNGTVDCNPGYIDYEWDDFGNVIRVKFPWTGKTDGSRGTTRYQYNALGNVIQKQNEEMRASSPSTHLTYGHDALGRLLEVTRDRGNGQRSPQFFHLLLYRLTWDTSSMSEPGCPVLANSRGRLAFREDSFGKTGHVYDEEGHVLQEVRVRSGFSGCSGGSALDDQNPHTFYSYTPNGDLGSISYPHGRQVIFVNDYSDGAGRVRRVQATISLGSGWSPPVTLIDDVAWEPYGGLRGYVIFPLGTPSQRKRVEYSLAGGAESVPPGALSSCSDLEANSGLAPDGSGRLRGVFVSDVSAALGSPTGDVLKQLYRWQGDALAQQWTCYRNASTPPRSESFATDYMQRLTSAVSSTGASEAFAFAGAEGRRGNRTALATTNVGASCTQQSVSAAQLTGQPFQLDLLGAVQWGWNNGGSTCNVGNRAATGKYVWAWDKDGRRSTMSDATSNYTVTTGYAQTRLGAGLDSVIHTATISGFSNAGGNYTYFYDAFGRRRAKSLPWWPEGDEFFYDLGHELLSDRGVNSIGSTPNEYPEADYVWLGGRPVVAIQGKFAINSDPAIRTMVRQADEGGSCNRNGEAQTCGAKFIVTDYIGKPVLVLDGASEPRIAATASYGAFGHANRTPLFYGSSHYVAGSELVSEFTVALPQPLGWDANARVLMHRTQGVNDGSGFPFFTFGAPSQPVILELLNDTAHRWSTFSTSPNGQYLLSNVGNAGSYGLDTEALEVRIKESSTSWWFPRLRLPGQYFDEETDLHENWNRFYDPSTGGFTGPEPTSGTTLATFVAAKVGRTLPPYAFANNNPKKWVDPDGLLPLGVPGINPEGPRWDERRPALGAPEPEDPIPELGPYEPPILRNPTCNPPIDEYSFQLAKAYCEERLRKLSGRGMYKCVAGVEFKDCTASKFRCVFKRFNQCPIACQ